MLLFEKGQPYSMQPQAKQNSFFSIVLFVLLTVCALVFGVHLIHIEQKIDHVSIPAKLFKPHDIESPNLSKFAFPDTMSHDLNKFCYIFSQQSLYWLHKGENCYVFETKDGSRVVKFLPLKMKQKLLRQVVLSSQLAFDLLAQETGLEFLHLNRTNRVTRGMSLTDFYGQQHRIYGDNTRFVVQKKASLLFPTLHALIQKGEIEQAKKRIDQVVDLLEALAIKKVSDGGDEYSLNDVIGFTADRAIYMDTWKFFKAPFLDVKSRMSYEFRVRLSPLKKWLDIMSPELAEYFRVKRDTYLQAN